MAKAKLKATRRFSKVDLLHFGSFPGKRTISAVQTFPRLSVRAKDTGSHARSQSVHPVRFFSPPHSRKSVSGRPTLLMVNTCVGWVTTKRSSSTRQVFNSPLVSTESNRTISLECGQATRFPVLSKMQKEKEKHLLIPLFTTKAHFYPPSWKAWKALLRNDETLSPADSLLLIPLFAWKSSPSNIPIILNNTPGPPTPPHLAQHLSLAHRLLLLLLLLILLSAPLPVSRYPLHS